MCELQEQRPARAEEERRLAIDPNRPSRSPAASTAARASCASKAAAVTRWSDPFIGAAVLDFRSSQW